MITRKTALKRLFGLAIGGFFLVSLSKLVFADYIKRFAGKEMFIFRDDGSSVWGIPGDIKFGDGTLRVVSPESAGKIDLGTNTLDFNDAFFDGTVRTDALRIDLGSDTAVSSGTGTVKMTSANNADSTGFQAINVNGTVRHFPFWDDPSP